MIKEIYKENIGNFFLEQYQEKFLTYTVGIIGCGASGQYILEYLIRLGVKKIICFDGDQIEESNLNRQIYTSYNNLGKSKIKESFKHCKTVNNNIIYNFYNIYYNYQYKNVLKNCNFIINCADNLSEKDVDSLLKLNIPLFDCTLWYKGTSSFWVNGNIENIIDFKLGYNSKKEKIKISSPNFICGLAASLTIIHIINVIIQHQKILSIKYNFYQNNIEIEKKE